MTTDKIQAKKEMRALGCGESLHYILDSYSKILRNVVVHVELDKQTDNNIITNSLRIIHNQFIALQTRIAKINELPYFITDVNFYSIPLDIDTDKTDPIQAFETELNTKINSEKFLWRAKIIDYGNKKIVLLTFHHSIFDGISINIILNKLAKKEKLIINKENDAEFFHPIEHQTNTNIAENNTYRLAEKEKILAEWRVNKSCDINKQRTKIIVLNNDLNIMMLKKLSRSKNVSINSIINALVIKTISQLQPKHQSFIIHTPISLRNHSNNITYKTEVGYFISILHLIVKNSEDKSIVEIAKLYAKELALASSNMAIQRQFDYFDMKSTIIKKFTKDTKSFHGGIAVSNIGTLEINNSAIRNVMFSTSLLGGLGILLISALGFDNSLKLTISYTEPLLSKEFIDSFTKIFGKLSHKLNAEILLCT